jgi:predicted SnoaL-like aldol condensation-catalyzing enzyme
MPANAIYSDHAQVRAQQRGVPPIIVDWLCQYGEQQYDGHGGVVRYFTERSKRSLERAVGKTVVRRLSEYLRCYVVESSHDGGVITVGKRYGNHRFHRH